MAVKLDADQLLQIRIQKRKEKINAQRGVTKQAYQTDGFDSSESLAEKLLRNRNIDTKGANESGSVNIEDTQDTRSNTESSDSLDQERTEKSGIGKTQKHQRKAEISSRKSASNCFVGTTHSRIRPIQPEQFKPKLAANDSGNLGHRTKTETNEGVPESSDTSKRQGNLKSSRIENEPPKATNHVQGNSKRSPTEGEPRKTNATQFKENSKIPHPENEPAADTAQFRGKSNQSSTESTPTKTDLPKVKRNSKRLHTENELTVVNTHRQGNSNQLPTATEGKPTKRDSPDFKRSSKSTYSENTPAIGDTQLKGNSKESPTKRDSPHIKGNPPQLSAINASVIIGTRQRKGISQKYSSSKAEATNQPVNVMQQPISQKKQPDKDHHDHNNLTLTSHDLTQSKKATWKQHLDNLQTDLQKPQSLDDNALHEVDKDVFMKGTTGRPRADTMPERQDNNKQKKTDSVPEKTSTQAKSLVRQRTTDELKSPSKKHINDEINNSRRYQRRRNNTETEAHKQLATNQNYRTCCWDSDNDDDLGPTNRTKPVPHFPSIPQSQANTNNPREPCGLVKLPAFNGNRKNLSRYSVYDQGRVNSDPNVFHREHAAVEHGQFSAHTTRGLKARSSSEMRLLQETIATLERKFDETIQSVLQTLPKQSSMD